MIFLFPLLQAFHKKVDDLATSMKQKTPTKSALSKRRKISQISTNSDLDHHDSDNNNYNNKNSNPQDKFIPIQITVNGKDLKRQVCSLVWILNNNIIVLDMICD